MSYCALHPFPLIFKLSESFIKLIFDLFITIIKSLKVIISFFYKTEMFVSKISKPAKLKPLKMHVLQPKHIKLKPEEVDKLLSKLNISLAQLPKIKITDPLLPEDCDISNGIMIEREG